MWDLCVLLLCSAVILNSIGLHSQSNNLPGDGLNPGFHHCGPSPLSPGRHCPDTPHSLASAHYSAGSPRSSEPTARARSRSPNLEQTFFSVFGFRYEDLAFIRLIPYINPNRIFELRRYAFLQDKSIGLRTKNYTLDPMPTGEQIALSMSNGDVCAILGKSSSRNTILRPIFTYIPGGLKRAKININSGAVDKLTAEEIAECPVTARESITNIYRILRSSSESKGLPDAVPNPDVQQCGPPSSPPSGRHPPDTTHSLTTPHSFTGSPPRSEPPIRDRSKYPSLRKTFRILLGFKFEELESIRLMPYINQNRIFELRIYVFPPDKSIGMKTKKRSLDPMPTGDQIVLSTSNGDVYAILEKSSSKNTRLRPIFTYIPGISKRVKINMNSGMVKELTAEEITECPVTAGESVTKSYRVALV